MEYLGETLAEVEIETIVRALNHFKGNKRQTARALGICLRTMRNKINHYQLLQFKGRILPESFTPVVIDEP